MNYAEELPVDLKAKRGKADGVRFQKPGYAKAAQTPKAPQAVVKVISQARGHRVSVLMNYVARTDSEKPLTMEDENGLQVEGAEAIQATYENWREDFERAAPGQKRPPRHVTHMIFSGDCPQSPENARAVQSAVAELMREQLGKDGYRYLMVLHEDTDHPHVHVLVNNYNRDPEKPKLRINPPELLVLREQFAQKMRERGLEQHATRRIDRPQLLERIAQGIEDLRAGGKWYEARMLRAAEKSAGIDAQATEKMLELAGKIADKTGERIEATYFETVRAYLDRHSTESGAVLGLEDHRPDTDKPRAFDAFAKRRAMAATVAKIKADIKASTLPFSKERREAMAALREVDKQLIEPAAPDYGRVLENLALKIGKDVDTVKDYMRNLNDPAGVAQDHKRRRQREGAIHRILTRQLEAVRSARLDLLRQPGLSIVEGYTLGHQLKQHERQLNRLRLALDFGAAQVAAPGTPAQVAAARAAALDMAWIERTTAKLEAMGAWHQPTPGRDKPRTFDAFAKRESMAKILTHVSDALERLPAGAGSPVAERVAALRTRIEAPAPDYPALVDKLKTRLQDTRQRVDFEARKAAHPGTAPADRAAILDKLGKELTGRVDALTRARRELKDAPIAAEKRAALDASLKRMARTATKAAASLEQPAALAKHLKALDGTPPQSATTTRSPTHGKQHADPYAAGYGLKNSPATPWRGPQFDGQGFARELAPQSLAGVRVLSRVGLVQAAQRGESLLPDHAPAQLDNRRADADRSLRRPIDSHSGRPAGEVARPSPAENRLARIDPATANQGQLADLLAATHRRLIEAGGWDDPAPFRSAMREAIDGKPAATAPAMDAFEKRRHMIAEADRVTAVIDGTAGRVDFTADMRRDLAAIRELRERMNTTPARNLEEVLSRLAQKVTDDQLRIERMTDKRPATATEALQQRRAVDRIAERNLRSIEDARRAVQAQPGVPPMQRINLAAKLQPLQKTMELYGGKGRGR